MAKNNIVKGKITQRRRSLGSGWSANVLKSLGYSARDVITDVMPNATSAISDAREAKMELDEALSMAAKKSKEMAASGKSKLQSLKDKEIREAIEDIKSGKLYNPDRIKDIFEDFDLDGFGDFGTEDFDSGESSGKDVTLSIDIPDNSPVLEAQAATTATVSKSAEFISKENRANSMAIASTVAKMSVGIAGNLDLLHSEVAKLSTTLPKSITEHAALSAKYYEESIGYQKKISESLERLETLYSTSQKVAGETGDVKKKSALDKYSNLDLDGYKELIKSNFKSNVGPYASMITTAIDLMKEMGGPDKGVSAMGLNTLMKAVIGKGVKASAGKVDKFLENLLLPVGMKIGKLQDSWDDPVKRLVGNLFGIKARPNTSVDKSKYEKGAVAFDGKVHRAITDIIPTYLRMITSALTGKEEIAFDYEKGVYNTVGNIRKDFDKNLKDSVTNTYFSEKFDFGRIVDKLDGISKEQSKAIKESFDDFLYGMAKSSDLVSFRKNGDRDDIAKLTGRNSDDPVVQIIRDYFEGLYDQGRHAELNEIFGRKSLNAKRSLEDTVQRMMADGTTSNYHLIDNGLYSSSNGRKPVEVATTGSGIGLDKYNRTSTSYLRDILATLSTGIRVVNVGTVDSGAGAIISHSNKMLQSLSLDEATFTSAQNAQSTPTASAGAISYDSEKAMETIASVLDDRIKEDDALDWIVKKFGNKNGLGRVAKSLQAKRTSFNNKADQIANSITGRGIDALYGKRTRPSGDNENGPDINPDEVPDATVTTETAGVMVTQFSRQLRDFGNAFNREVIQKLKLALFDEDEGLVTKIEEAEIGESDEEAKETTAKVATKAGNVVKAGVLGEKNEETGEYTNGLLSAEANMAAVAKANMSNWSHDLIYGTKDGKEKGLLGHVREFFGETEDGKLNITGKAQDAKKTLKDHLMTRAYEWSELIFGKDEEGEQKKLDIFLGDMKGQKGAIAGAATVGVLGSFFLPGGPVTGAIIGAGIGIVSKSTQLKNFLFGEEGEDGERVGGLITKEYQDFFKENKGTIKKGAALGLIGSFFLPGGPVGGALVGSALAMATKSEAFSKLLYGEGGTKEDPTGGITKFIKEHYSKDKSVKATFLDAGIGAGVGLVGSFFLPGGPITGALIGAGANMAINTDKFKDYFFGKEDPEDGKRKGGVFGKLRDNLEQKAHETQDKLSLWIAENVTNPLKASMEPLKKRAKNFLFGNSEDAEDKGLIGAIAERVDRSSFGDLKRAVKEHIIDKMKNGFKMLFNGLGKLLGSIIKSPVTALKAVAENGNEEGDNSASIAKRIEELNAASRKEVKERAAKRKARYGKAATKATAPAEPEQETAENTAQTADAAAQTAEATTNIESIAKEQLDSSKENHAETMSALEKLLKIFPRKTGGAEEDGQTGTALGSSNNSITGSNLVERIDHNVEKIAKSVDGQLDGTGYNLHRIYKLLRKKLKSDGDDDDEDDDTGSGGKHYSLWGRIKRFSPKRAIKSAGSFVKKQLSKVFGGVSKVFHGILNGFLGIGRTILKVPGMLINGAKKALPKLGKMLGGMIDAAGGFLRSALKGLGNVIDEASKGFGVLISGAMQGLGSLLHGVGLLGKEALNLLGKGIHGVATGAAFIAKSAAGAVAKLFGGKGGKFGKEKVTKFVLDGGHLDYVTVVKHIGDDIDPLSATASNIVNFPGSMSGQMGEDGQAAAFSGAAIPKFSIRGAASAAMARVKGSMSSIKARFANEDKEKKENSWRDKILGLVTKNTEGAQKHHSVWSSIFSKKGLITAGLILMAPIILKAVKGIMNFLGSGVWDAIKNSLNRLGNSLSEIGGIGGLFNNVKEEATVATDALGITDRKEIKIDEATGTAELDENGQMIYENKGKGSRLSRIKEFFLPTETKVDHKTGKLYQESQWNHQTQMAGNIVGTATHLAAKKVAKGVKAVKNVASSGKLDTILKFCKKAVDFLLGKMGKLLEKHGAGKMMGKLTGTMTKITNKLLTGTVLGKFIGKFAKPLAKAAAAAGTALASDAVWFAGGAIAGAANAGELFQVNPEDVDAKMRMIAAIFKGILNTSWAGWLDVIDDIAFEVLGFSFISEVASLVYKILSPEDDAAKLDEAQKKFDDEYTDYVEEEYEAYVRNMEDSGKGSEALSFEDFKSSELATSRADFNADKNPSLGKRVFDGVKGIGKGIGKAARAVGTATANVAKWELPHRETALVSPTGAYYLKNNSGTYDKFSKLGVMVNTNIPEADINAMVESGELAESKKWVAPKRIQAIEKLGITAGKTFVQLLNFGKEVATEFKDGVVKSYEYWKTNIKENGIFGAVKKAFKKKEEKGWFDVKGGYYVLNDDGESYNYYNANGDLVSENVDKDEVDDMIYQGMLTESDIIKDSDAQATIKKIKEKISDLWDKAKSTGSKAIDNVKAWLGLDSSKVVKTDGSNGGGAGRGGDESATASTSGKLNGFAYYSQNDPKFSSQDYGLSDGGGGTIGERGCGPAAMSMVASQLTGQNIDPAAAANVATREGYSITEGTRPEYFSNAAGRFGLRSENMVPTAQNIKTMLNNGVPIIMQGQDSREGSPFTGEGHYVVGVGMNGDNVIVNDPRGRKYSKEYPIDSVLSGAQNMWGFGRGSSGASTTALGFNGSGTGADGDMLNGFPYLLQGDDRWGGTPYTAIGDPKQTIASSACGPTSMAMVLRSFGNSVTPVDTADYALANGYRTANSGTSWEFFPSIGGQYGLSTNIVPGTVGAITKELKEGNPIIASMGPSTFTKGGHYIVLSGITSDGQIIVNDPGKVSRSNVTYDPSVFANEGKAFWSFTQNGRGSINNVMTPGQIDIRNPQSILKATAITEGTPDAKALTASSAEKADTSTISDKPGMSASDYNRTGIVKPKPGMSMSDYNRTGISSSSPSSSTIQLDESVDEDTEEKKGTKSIAEILLGAASAFAKPIYNWFTGNKDEEEESDCKVIGSDGSVVNSDTSFSRPGMSASDYNRTGISSSSGSAVGPNGSSNYSPSASVQSSAVAKTAWDYFDAQGYSDAAKAGILGNAYAESKLNPEIIQSGGAGPAAGFFQWENYNTQSGRWKGLADYAASKGKDWTDLQSQLEYGHTELQKLGPFWTHAGNMQKAGTIGTSYDEWKNSTDVETATRQFEGAFERAGKPHMDTRIEAALKYYNLYTQEDQGKLIHTDNHGVTGVSKPKPGVAYSNNQGISGGTANKASTTPTTTDFYSILPGNQKTVAGKGGKTKPISAHMKSSSWAVGGKGGVSSISDTAYSSDLMDSADRYTERKSAMEIKSNPLLARAVELLGYIVDNTSGINQGVKDLFNKETPAPTQIIDGTTHNNIIPTSQNDDKQSSKDLHQYNTAKQISRGIIQMA